MICANLHPVSPFPNCTTFKKKFQNYFQARSWEKVCFCFNSTVMKDGGEDLVKKRVLESCRVFHRKQPQSFIQSRSNHGHIISYCVAAWI